MRWVFTFIVIINAVAFWWYSSQPESDADAKNKISNAELKNIPSLVLLSERDNLPADQPQTESTAAESGDVAAVGEAEKQALATEQQKTVDGKSQQDGLAEKAITEETPMTTSTLATDKPKMCIELGPFSEVISARQVKSRLSSLDMPADIEERKIAIDPVYWVYIEPSENRAHALALLRELQNKRIDSFLISEGEFANGISLGFFRQQDSAEEIRQKRVKQGYDAKIRLKERFKDRFWLSLSAESAAKFSDSLMTNLLSEYNYLQKKENSCDRVASTPNFE